LPAAAGAQAPESEDARAAELACQLAGLCGDVAQAEADRDKEVIAGVETRGLPSMGALMAAGKGASGSRPASRVPSPRAEAPERAQAVRTAKRSIPASVGRRAPVVRSAASSAADVPESLARRAPLFITFGLNSAKLTAESASEVRSFAKALKAVADSGQDKRYRIEGHTDSSGNEAINHTLSEQRAAAVREALLAAGVDGSRIEVAGFGSDQPIEGYDKGNPINRRVEAVEIQ
jgi:outer membrane protein OmpA-like peptidoglycan-associated protein